MVKRHVYEHWVAEAHNTEEAGAKQYFFSEVHKTRYLVGCWAARVVESEKKPLVIRYSFKYGPYELIALFPS